MKKKLKKRLNKVIDIVSIADVVLKENEMLLMQINVLKEQISVMENKEQVKSEKINYAIRKIENLSQGKCASDPYEVEISDIVNDLTLARGNRKPFDPIKEAYKQIEHNLIKSNPKN